MIKNKAMIMNLRWVLLIGGLISFIFGVAVYRTLPADAHDVTMLMGMFTGLGSAFLAVGAVGLVMNLKMTPEQKRQMEIDQKDERNVIICGKAYKVSGIVTSICFAVTSFVMVAMGNRFTAYLCIGGMYVQIISMAVAQLYYQKKM
jgi:uncharacterized membrane protein